jgi:pimeloyl-ACP methyl ester carboxylesterase
MSMLLLSPDSSPFVAVSEMNDLRDGVKDAELRVFPHARHGLPLSHGAECGAALREFLDRHFRA